MESKFIEKVLLDLKKELIDMQHINLSEFIDSRISCVFEWKYSTHEYFNPLPYYHQLDKEKKGKILKDINNKEWESRDIFRFGFNKNGQLIVSEWHIGEKLEDGIYIDLYDYREEGFNKLYLAYYPQKKPRLIAISNFKNINNDKALFVTCNVYNDYSYNIYLYHERLLETVIKGASTWEQPELYKFLYKKNSLNKIIHGDSIYWKKK